MDFNTYITITKLILAERKKPRYGASTSLTTVRLIRRLCVDAALSVRASLSRARIAHVLALALMVPLSLIYCRLV